MKINHITIFLAGLLFLVSCGEVKEEITFNKDGSGTLEMSTDMIPMMRSMMTEFAKMDVKAGETPDSTAVAKKVEEMIWKDFGNDVDSVLSFTEKIPPEIKDDPEKMAVINNMVMFMKGGKSKGYMKMGVNYPFKNPDNLQSFWDLMQESGQQDGSSKVFFENASTEVKVTDHSFQRITKQKVNEENNSMQMMGKIMDMSFITVINTPSKIKNLDLKTYELVSKTNKSVTLRYYLKDVLIENKPTEIYLEW